MPRVRQYDCGAPLVNRRLNGYAVLRYRDGPSITFASSERERLETAVRDGAPWFEGVDEYGGSVLCSLDGVRSVHHFPPESLAASREEEKAERIEGEP